MPNYCIGLGISGAILKLYCPEVKIIVKEGGEGGQIGFNFLNLKNLFVNKWNKRLLNDLNLNPEEVETRFGYYYNGEVTDEIPKEAQEFLLKKKLSEANYPFEEFDFNGKEVKFTHQGKVKIFDINFPELFNAIRAKLNDKDIIRKEVMLIDAKRQMIITKDFSRFVFDKLCSTIPAVDLQRFIYNLDLNRSFTYTPKTFIICDKAPVVLRDTFDKYNLIYCVDKFKFHRITKVGNGSFNYEFTGLFSKEELLQFIDSDVKILDYWIQRVALTHGEQLPDMPERNIWLLGRLAQFKHQLLTENIVQKVNEELIKEFR